MPSESKKKRDAKKKEAAKQRIVKKSTKLNDNDSGDDSPALQNGDAAPLQNGHVLENGVGESEGESSVPTTNGTCTPASLASNKNSAVDLQKLGKALQKTNLLDESDAANFRSCTGVLASHPRSKDLKIDSFSLTFHGWEMLSDTKIEFNCGRRYGFIGLNGSGKSTLLEAIANREVPIPDHIDIFMLSREIEASDKTALEAVIEVDKERAMLEDLAEELAQYGDEESHDKLMDVYERLDEMGADTAEATAAEILYGLGFNKEMQNRACKHFSGGWRMRIALARTLYLKPSLLLLDEPTNHLDLDACVWLEEELQEYKRILVVVSHSQDFMNNVCTNIIHLHKRKLEYYGGNYDAFVKTREELEENQMKRHNWEQSQIAHMKDYIARFGHGSAKLARQAQSKEKTLQKMVQGGLTDKVSSENVKQFYFNDPGAIPPPVIMVQHVSFAYAPDKPLIYKDLDFGVDLDTRIALVGPNGAGKSTLLKLIDASLMPSDGLIRRHSHVKIGTYHQHLAEQLDLTMSALDYICKEFSITDMESGRRIIGRFGISGKQQTCPMKQLSDGQRCRVSFAWLAYQNPHLLLLDEPTNHLDMETIDALADAINEFTGGMILVSHDFRLINQVAEIIWVCEHQKVTKFDGDIFAYKEMLRKKLARQKKKAIKLAAGNR